MDLSVGIVASRFNQPVVDELLDACLSQLEKEGAISKRKVKKAIKKYQINDVTAAEAGNTEGSG